MACVKERGKKQTSYLKRKIQESKNEYNRNEKEEEEEKGPSSRYSTSTSL